MRAEHPAGGFLRHRALILVAAGGAVAEAGLLTLVAPAARPIAPQVTALPVLAAYHDLRWLFADGQSWLSFIGVLAATLLLRSAMDTVLLRLAWPGTEQAPRVSSAFCSCLLLTALAWVFLSPVVTLAFGVAVLPFSWPFIAALPLLIGMLLVLSHGGLAAAWWRRLPPLRSMAWLLGSFVVLSAAAGGIAHLDTPAALAVAAAAGLVNARAWYGMAMIAARLHPRPHVSVPAKVLLGLPFAPIAALMVLVVVVGVARLMFTGSIKIGGSSHAAIAAAANTAGGAAGTAAGPSPAPTAQAAQAAQAAQVTPAAQAAHASHPAQAAKKAVLVIAGWGSSCCNAANALRAVSPGVIVRQFSYTGLNAKGQPLPSGPDADDIPLPALGDRLATQLLALHKLTNGPVDVVAESEGTLGVYAMLDRHPRLPVGSVVLLSPIVEPGQLTYPPGDNPSVSEYALNELNHFVGGISPYGPGGAAQLLGSVSEVGARYFDHLTTAAGTGIRWLAVIPLADALTLPDCGLPPGVVLVPAFHGGLLGDASVLPMVNSFLDGNPVRPAKTEESSLRTEAELITAAAAAWRMPQTTAACP
jgi:hypothetical protein